MIHITTTPLRSITINNIHIAKCYVIVKIDNMDIQRYVKGDEDCTMKSLKQMQQ